VECLGNSNFEGTFQALAILKEARMELDDGIKVITVREADISFERNWKRLNQWRSQHFGFGGSNFLFFIILWIKKTKVELKLIKNIFKKILMQEINNSAIQV
jgi:hypothetical protein